ncbi:4-hydroxyphenylacetate 3-hydroxylase family protein [Pseudonocardia sp. H11422]|uniref:4-hydroxyphenylacetate 3-hydroxylase family protein n=1 Tax=Pseudonocardia sp. H11422 TaxID=2835866 RepID=UPI001BDC236E|nr:4-hydroxyphenylacetate 3-hydroxylase family protein [Pseudonocardia sp. H11422]
MGINTDAILRTGEQYKKALRDGRVVWYGGERIDDVTTHPATAGGIDRLAEIFDMQHDPRYQDTMTFVREDGQRVTRAWQLPRTKEELRAKREMDELASRHTLGMFGRHFDNIAWTTLGLAAYEHLFTEPELAGNIGRYIRYAQDNNIMIGGIVADPQGARAKEKWSIGERIPLKHHGDTDRLPPLLRVVEKRSDGIVIAGAKIVGTVIPQADEILILTQPGVSPEESFWCALPANSEGLHIVLRQALAHPPSATEHPLASKGEEQDCLVILDNVFVPMERVFSLGNPDLPLEYGDIGAGEHWNTLVRMAVKAELLVAVAQMIIDSIGTVRVAKVREIVADLVVYAQVQRSLAMSAQDYAITTESGVVWPQVDYVTAGRVYGVEHYGTIMGKIREMAGQGPLMLFTDKDFSHPELGPLLCQVTEGFDLVSEEKNLLMGLVWDITSDSFGMRVDYFERLNGYPLFFLKERLFGEYDRVAGVEHLARFLGLPVDKLAAPARALAEARKPMFG